MKGGVYRMLTDDPTHTATVKPFKIPVYEVYKNSP